MAKSASVIDLFCGIGGLSHGFMLEKFNLLAGVDFDGTCRYAFEVNNKSQFLERDLTITHSHEIESLYPRKDVKILVGCAPCQAFSTLSQKYKENDKWKLLYSFARFIKDIRPEIVSMENVPNLLRYSSGAVFNDFLATLKKQKYHINFAVVNAADYGVPQNRNRLILIASKYGMVPFIDAKKFAMRRMTVRDAIGHLPEIADGESHPSDVIHRARKLSALNKKRIIATKEGGGWNDWPEHLQLECHKKETGRTFRSVYGRMSWDDIAPTLTTQCTGLGNGRFGHPEQDRAISLREAALLQSFPASYKLIDPSKPFVPTILERHIGNAVPVSLGRMIAKSIKNHLKQHGIEVKR